MIAHNCHRGGSVMVLGGITMTGRTELHICKGNVTGFYHRHDVIEPIIVPYARRHGTEFVFQGANARAHRTRVVQDHLQFRRITTLTWQAKSVCLQLNILWTSSGDVSGDGLTSHRTSTSSLMNSKRNGAGSPKQPLGSLSGA